MTEETLALLRCPICRGAFARNGNSLICPSRHCFDIARQGYVNLIPQQKESFYRRELFESRAEVFAAGVYAPVTEAVSRTLDERVEKPDAVLVDAGCGEGYYAKAVCPGRPLRRIGFDLSRDAVKLAARGPKTADFFTGDLANIPLTDGCADVLLDVFTPANYREFARVLKPGGLLVKLAPREDYLIQLRHAAGTLLRHASYDGGDVERYFAEKTRLVAREHIRYTLPVSPRLAYHLARMTPMLAGIDVDALDLSRVTEITIDEEMFIGRFDNA